MKKSLIFYTMLFLIFAACNTGDKPASAEKADMGQFADDKKFQDAHETPEPTSFEGKGQMVEFATTDGKTGKAYQIKSPSGTGNTLFVIHEWWGLNDHIKKEAERLHAELGNTHVMALDLYDGNLATDPKQAGEFMKGVDENRLKSIIQGAMKHVGPDAKIGTVGWCFGGGWSLRSSIEAGKQAAGCVMYYGMPVKSAKELAPLATDVIFIHPKQDEWITQEVVDGFTSIAKATGKKVTVHQFEADHAFANPSRPSYIEEDAKAANEITLNFFKERLK